MTAKTISKTMVVVALAFGCLSGFGCQSIDLSTAQPETPVQQDVVGQYQVQMVSKFGAAKVKKLDITAPLTVQDALQNAGAIDKYRDMTITLNRVVKDSGRLLRLPVSYEARSQTVRPEQNYQILPGDSISIAPDATNSIEKMAKSLAGGLI